MRRYLIWVALLRPAPEFAPQLPQPSDLMSLPGRETDIDWVKITGTTDIPPAALPSNTTSLLYVPLLDANGPDSFEYRGTDCPGTDFRLSQPARIDIDIRKLSRHPHTRITPQLHPLITPESPPNYPLVTPESPPQQAAIPPVALLPSCYDFKTYRLTSAQVTRGAFCGQIR